MKSNKVLMWTLILVPIAAGGWFLWKYLKGPGAIDRYNPDGQKITLPPVKALSTSVFPLKNGSPKNELVKQLQGLLGVTPDGAFGPKTAAALVVKTGKSQITSQADFDAVIAKLNAAAKKSSNTSRADKLISDWKASTNLQMMPVDNVWASQVTIDNYGAVTLTGKEVGLAKNVKYNRDDYVLTGSSGNGYLVFKVTKGDKTGMYKVDPSKISLA